LHLLYVCTYYILAKNGIHSTRLASLERDLKRNGVMAKREKGYMMEAEAAAEKGGDA
jgi:hypothetical protein